MCPYQCQLSNQESLLFDYSLRHLPVVSPCCLIGLRATGVVVGRRGDFVGYFDSAGLVVVQWRCACLGHVTRNVHQALVYFWWGLYQGPRPDNLNHFLMAADCLLPFFLLSYVSEYRVTCRSLKKLKIVTGRAESSELRAVDVPVKVIFQLY